MAKGRFVSKSIATNEQIASVSFAADYFFQRCIPHLDVEGRLAGNPLIIKATVAPLRDEITAANIPDLIRELALARDHDGTPLVIWYEVNGIKVLEFPGFEGQQEGLRKDRERESRLPARVETATILIDSGKPPAALPHNSGKTPQKRGAGPAQVKRSEVKRSEVNGTSGDVPPAGRKRGSTPHATASPPASEYPPEFERAWELYPKRPSNPKKGAFRAWSARVKQGADPTLILEGVVRYAAYCAAEQIGGTSKCMQAQTFFGPDERWTESYEISGGKSGATSDPRAVELVALAREFDLFAYSGNGAEYNAKILKASKDDRAGENFRAELKRWKPWEGLGVLATERAMVAEVGRRLAMANGATNGATP